MLFTPKQRGRDWYWFNKMWLYMFSFLSGVAAIVGLLSFEVAFSERLLGAAMFTLAALICWKLGRYCSTTVAKMGEDGPRS